MKETWKFVPKQFNGTGDDYQIGSISIEHPNGIALWFAAVEEGCNFDESDQQLIDRVVRVLNRELPGGEFRVRRKGVRNGN